MSRLGLLFVFAACGESPEGKEAKPLERGDKYFEQGYFREALIEYRETCPSGISQTKQGLSRHGRS